MAYCKRGLSVAAVSAFAGPIRKASFHGASPENALGLARPSDVARPGRSIWGQPGAGLSYYRAVTRRPARAELEFMICYFDR